MSGRSCALRVAQANPAPNKATSINFDIIVPPKANLSRENTSVARKYSWFSLQQRSSKRLGSLVTFIHLHNSLVTRRAFQQLAPRARESRRLVIATRAVRGMASQKAFPG